MTATNLANEFRHYYETKTGTGGTYLIWYDYAVVKLNHLFESMDHIGLTQKLDASLRLCGTENVTVGSAGTPGNPANNTFPNTCPLLVHYDPKKPYCAYHMHQYSSWCLCS